MKTSAALLLLTASVADSFMVATPPSRQSLTVRHATKDEGHPILSRMIQTLGSAVESFVAKETKAPDDARMLRDLESAQKEWQQEAERVHQVEHSLETDPDLSGLLEPHKEAQKAFIDKESHRHDSLFAEIEHAIDNDPDLANVVSSHKKETKTVNAGFMEKEAHVHDSLFSEIEHSLDNDPDLYSM